MRKFFLPVHLLAALGAGLFMCVLGATGAVMAFEPELDHLFHRELYDIPSPGNEPLRLTSLARIVESRFPGTTVVSFGLPRIREGSYRVDLSSDTSIYVNEYTGEMLGTTGGPDLLSAIHQLHIRLLAGNTGQTIIRASGAVAAVIILSGLILWWRYKRFGMKRHMPLFRFMFDLHAVTGIYSALFLVFLTLTGIVISFEDPILNWLYAITDTKPIPYALPSTPAPGSATLDPDRVLEIARRAVPDAAPLNFWLPQDSLDSFIVRLRHQEDLTPGGRSWVSIDRYSGKVLVAVSSRTAPGPLRFMIMVRAIHTGDIYGMFSKIIMSLSSLLIVVQAVSGYSIWWIRDGKKGRLLPPG